LALRRGFYRKRELIQRGRIVYAQGKWAKRLGTQAKRLSYVKAGASILSSAAMAKYYGGSTVATTGASTGASTGGMQAYQFGRLGGGSQGMMPSV